MSQPRENPQSNQQSIAPPVLLHNIGTLYTCDALDRVIQDAWIVIRDGRIDTIGSGPPPGGLASREDMGGAIVMPGLINMHHHFFQTLTRAVPAALRGHLIDWLGRMYPLWSGMAVDDLAAATHASAAQLLLTGATTSVDHAYLLPRGGREYVDAEITAARSSGMRLVFVRGSMTAMEAALEEQLTPFLGRRAGGLVDEPQAVLQDMRRCLAEYHDPTSGSMLQVALGPTTTTYEDPSFMRAVADLAREARCGLHIHFHPRPDERALCADQGSTPLDFLQDHGWLGPQTFFAHGTRLTAQEMDRCAAAGVSLVHCPRMILRLGARITPIHEMLAAGMRVGVGVDGGASNDSGSMLGELRVAMLLHRLTGGEGDVSWDQWLSPYRLLCMATRDSADILGRNDIGRVEPGTCADLTAYKTSSVAFAGARTDPLAGLFLAGDDDRASMTMVGGRILVRDRQLVGADEDEIREKVDSATRRLLKRATTLTGTDYHLMI